MSDHIAQIKHWFQLAVPTPTDKNRAVQIGCHFEEVVEMMDATGGKDSNLRKDLSELATGFKLAFSGVYDEIAMGEVDEAISSLLNNADRKELLDALCDQIVTAVGVAHMFGMDIDGALAEVTRSNWSKFVDGKPVFDANGKIAKPPTFSPADVGPFTRG